MERAFPISHHKLLSISPPPLFEIPINMKKTGALVTLAALASTVNGHGYMANPAPRAETIPGHRYSADPQSDGIRYANCADGGKIGPIQATWTQGQEVKVEISVTAYHGGYHQLRFCKDPYGANECLQQNLAIAVPSSQIYRGCPVSAPPSSADAGSCIPNAGCPSENKDDCIMNLDGIGRYNYTFILPPDLVCEHCVVQWWWGTNNYAPEHFKSCHDVRIIPSGPTTPPSPTPPGPTAPPTIPPTPPTCLRDWENCFAAPGNCCSGLCSGNQCRPT
jgi:hypothetical protein